MRGALFRAAVDLETCVKGEGAGGCRDGVECDICEGGRGGCTGAGGRCGSSACSSANGTGEGGDLRDRSEEVKGSAY